ncbi:MAG: hypothetical protein WA461_12790 [Nitrososphaeraceae archaeon]
MLRNRKEEIVDLTDIGNHNHTTVVRDRDREGFKHIIDIIPEDKMLSTSKFPSTEVTDSEVGWEERLKAEGATIIDSTTYYPASNQRITKKSLTSAEIAEERMFNYYDR